MSLKTTPLSSICLPMLNIDCKEQAIATCPYVFVIVVLIVVFEFSVIMPPRQKNQTSPGCHALKTKQGIHPAAYLTIGYVKMHESNPQRRYIHLEKSKTVQIVKGMTLWTVYSHSPLCPVCSMQANIALQKQRLRTPSSLLFFFSSAWTCVCTFTLDFLRLTGLGLFRYSGHSNPIGGATTASPAGDPSSLIKTLGA